MSKKPSSPTLTRREFVLKVSQYGGCAFGALSALGFVSNARGAGPDLSQMSTVKGSHKVIIMGAGLAGMTAAYELGKVGVDCVVLEPRAKAGGRCMTFRGGDVLEETNGNRQTCDFASGSYFNPGPSRFPQWHITMDYCRELGVEVEPFINLNENAYYYVSGAKGPLSEKRMRIREAKTDMRGYAAELLAKVADQGGLDQQMSAEDVERMLEFLRLEGGLQPDLAYRGHNRRGYAENPGGGDDAGVLGTPYPLSDLLQAGFGQWFHRANDYLYQSQMFTPRGGMDKIAQAFHEKLKEKVILGAKVVEFRRTNPGVRVVYETADGSRQEVTGDYGICTIPPTVLRRIPNDFSMMVKNTLNIVPFQNSGKIGLQFKRRFWEEDDRIFGGLSWTDLPIAELWYPNNGFFSKKGVMNGYYLFGPMADQVGQMTPEERTEFALEHGSKVHPQYREEFESAFSCNWATIPHIEGCLAHFPPAMKNFYSFLTKPDGELYIAASWASHLGGWQAGAFESARIAVHDIYERIRATAAAA